jgi:PIN domain nuclease of toxin-antitoxin system
MAVKANKLRLSCPLAEYLNQKLFARAICILDIEEADILKFQELRFSADPFDTLIVAMAQRLDCPLITAASIIHPEKPCRVFRK